MFKLKEQIDTSQLKIRHQYVNQMSQCHNKRLRTAAVMGRRSNTPKGGSPLRETK